MSTPTPAPRRKRGCWSSLGRFVLIAPLHLIGWLVVLLALAMLFVDITGYGKRKLEDQLARRLAVVGSQLSIGDVDFDWMGPGLTIRDLRIYEGEREHLHLESIYLAANLESNGRVELNRLDIEGGRALVSDATIDDLRALMNAEAAREEDDDGNEALRLPSIQVRGFHVDLEVPGSGISELGTLDLSMNAETDAPSKITGRVVLPALDPERRAPELYVNGLVELDGELELHAISDQLDIQAWDAPDFAITRQIWALSPQGNLSLHAMLGLSLTDDLEPEADLRLRMVDGALRIPEVAAGVEQVELALGLGFQPDVEEDFWAPRAWNGSGSLSAQFEGQTMYAGVRLGESARAGLAFEGWFQVPDFDVNTPAIRSLEVKDVLPTLYDALDPKGRVDARFAFACDEDYRPGADLWPSFEFLARVKGLGEVQAAYRGWPDPRRPGVEPMSFAMPARVRDARVVFAHTKRFPRHNLLDVRFDGTHPSGPVRGCYQQWSNPIDMPPFAPGYLRLESDLVIDVPEIALDQELRSRLPELYEIPELGDLFHDYGITGDGKAEARLRLCNRSEISLPALRVDVRVRNAQAAFSGLPVPAREVEAEVIVITDGENSSCVSFDARGITETSDSLRVSGRVSSQRDAPNSLIWPTRFDVIEVTANDIDLEGGELQVIAQTLPDVQQVLADLRPKGDIDLRYVRSSRIRQEVRDWIEITPRDAEVLPLAFPMATRDVRGRVLLESWDDPIPTNGDPVPDDGPTRTEVSIGPLVMSWMDRIPIGFEGRFDSDAPGRGRVLGAGLRPSNRDLLDSLAVALEVDPQSLRDDTRDLEIGGAVDFEYSFEVIEETEDPKSQTQLRLRGNDLRAKDGLRISGLSGTLELNEDRLTSPRIEARLGAHPLELSKVDIELGEDVLVADADLVAQGVEIDEDLLSQWLPPEEVERLIGDYGLRGSLDLDRGHLNVRVEEDRAARIRLSGEGTLSDAEISIDAPISLRSASLQLEDLTIEDGELRAWGRVEDLYGQALGRDLAQTGLLLSYYGSQLTIDELDGRFCRGRLTGLESQFPGDLPPPVLSIDTRAPHRFQLGLSIQEIDVGLLLADLFASEIADSGFLSGRLELRGELGDLHGVSGSGFGRVEQTVLWSVPVVRDLFGQLGLDDSAIFDEMESTFRIRNGAIRMDPMSVHSPLLNLRGQGTLGFDGALHHDLELTYSLVDKTGPLRSLIYWLQNNLLAISIRGDMSRPKIIPLGLFSNPFVSVDDPWRALPTPGFSDLPKRF